MQHFAKIDGVKYPLLCLSTPDDTATRPFISGLIDCRWYHLQAKNGFIMCFWGISPTQKKIQDAAEKIWNTFGGYVVCHVDHEPLKG